MITNEQARELAHAFLAALQKRSVEAILSLCSEDVEWSGLLVRKVTGDAAGTVRGQATVRKFVEALIKSGGAFGASYNRLGIGIRSVVIDVAFEGIIPGFVVLIADAQGKISHVLVHQEMP